MAAYFAHFHDTGKRLNDVADVCGSCAPLTPEKADPKMTASVEL
jgi:hypothetical protein